MESGTIDTYKLKKRVEAVKDCRTIGKKDMKFNEAMPKMHVDPESYVSLQRVVIFNFRLTSWPFANLNAERRSGYNPLYCRPSYGGSTRTGAVRILRIYGGVSSVHYESHRTKVCYMCKSNVWRSSIIDQLRGLERMVSSLSLGVKNTL